MFEICSSPDMLLNEAQAQPLAEFEAPAIEPVHHVICCDAVLVGVERVPMHQCLVKEQARTISNPSPSHHTKKHTKRF